MKPLVIFNPSGQKIEENVVYKYRSATRGIVLDFDGKIAALFKDNKYYSLPGGGTHEGESVEKAFVRECKEELGCIVEENPSLGMTIEYLDGFMNVTSVFFTNISGDKCNVELVGDEDEDEKACEVRWINKVELFDILKDLAKNGEEVKQFRYNRDLAILNIIRI